MGKARQKEGAHRWPKTPPLGLTSHRRSGLSAHPWVVLLLLALLATLIYSNTFSAPFLFDDNLIITENPRIKSLRNFLDLAGTRYVGYLSFALNYAIGGLSVLGYHLVNLVIHITNAFLVYCLVRLLWCTPAVVPTKDHTTCPASIALATALFFISHPIQTQAVTYIVQRLTALATMFYLLTVVCYLKWRLAGAEARSRYHWYGAALLATVLAMKTKEISFTLPVMLLLIEIVFFKPFTRTRLVSLVPFLLTPLIIPFSRIDALAGTEAGFGRETTEVSRLTYLFTQFRVVVTYLRLLILPVNQNAHYDYPIYHSLLEPQVFFSFLTLVSLVGVALALLISARHDPSRVTFRLIGFGLLWFFITLSIESSIIPIRDVIFEHRLYLPSVGVFLALGNITAIGLERLKGSAQRKSLLFSIAMTLIVFSVAAHQRNAVWKDAVGFWEDVVRKSPKKATAHNNLGLLYSNRGRLEEAMREHQLAIQLKPDAAEFHNNLGLVYIGLGRGNEAILAFQAALRFQPDNVHIRLNIAETYRSRGRWEEAILAYRAVLHFKPEDDGIHNKLGIAYYNLGRLEEAIREYRAALKIRPNFLWAHNNLGKVYAIQRRFKEAIEEFQTSLKLPPTDPPVHHEVHYDLGYVYLQQGLVAKAREEFERALKIKPDDLPAQQALEGLTHQK